MGISGLLPQLKSITRKTHVSKYRGKRIAIDAYCLLHRGAYSCARDLVEDIPTDKCTQYCMGRIDLLLQHGAIPYVVFDGGPLPNKSEEEQARHRSRKEYKSRARVLWQQGNKTAALECYQRAVDITPTVAKGFIEALKQRRIDFIVAPYEADAQMAYLALNGVVDIVLTEDSDLLAYGCPRVFFKMDKVGQGEEISLKDLPLCKELNFVGWTQDLFVEMCVMAGCDFAKAPAGIGIKKAHAHLRRCRSFLRAIKAIKFDGIAIPPQYEKKVQRAIWTFRHQRVYCPETQTIRHLNEPSGGDIRYDAAVPHAADLEEDEVDFLGPLLPQEVAVAIAQGDLNPITHQYFDDESEEAAAGVGVKPSSDDSDLAAAEPELQENGGNGSGQFSDELEGSNRGQQDEFNEDDNYCNDADKNAALGLLQQRLHASTANLRKGFKRPRPAGDIIATTTAGDGPKLQFRPRAGLGGRTAFLSRRPITDGARAGNSLKSMLKAAMNDNWNVPHHQQPDSHRPSHQIPATVAGHNDDDDGGGTGHNARRITTTDADLGLFQSPTIEEELGLGGGQLDHLEEDNEEENIFPSWQWQPRSAAPSPTRNLLEEEADHAVNDADADFNAFEGSTPSGAWRLQGPSELLHNTSGWQGITPDFYGGLPSDLPSSHHPGGGGGGSHVVRDLDPVDLEEDLRESLAPLSYVGGRLVLPRGTRTEDRHRRVEAEAGGVINAANPLQEIHHHLHQPQSLSLLPPSACEDPIADLSHLPTCVRVAKAAVTSIADKVYAATNDKDCDVTAAAAAAVAQKQGNGNFDADSGDGDGDSIPAVHRRSTLPPGGRTSLVSKLLRSGSGTKNKLKPANGPPKKAKTSAKQGAHGKDIDKDTSARKNDIFSQFAFKK